ncbi:hypothetical protein V8F20_001289 [Naviculisporaceae sp. PSN 640]
MRKKTTKKAVGKVVKTTIKPTPKETRASKRIAQNIVTRFQPYRKCAQRAQRFTFFTRLPAELRENVYRQFLSFPDEALDAASLWNKLPWNQPDTPQDLRRPLSIFQANKAIGLEAAHFFYSTNTFCFLEGCDDFTDDGDDITQHRIYRWLNKIGKVNCLSIRRLQLRMREERKEPYYTALFTHVSVQIPNLTRLGLVMEKHHVSRAADDSSAQLTRWEPNHIVSLDDDRIRAILKGLKTLSLKVIMVVDTRARAKFVQSLPVLAGCQVQAIEPKYARRLEDICPNFFFQKCWFVSPASSYNIQIRQAICQSRHGVEEYFKGVPTGDIQPESKDENETEPNEGKLSNEEVDTNSDDELN